MDWDEDIEDPEEDKLLIDKVEEDVVASVVQEMVPVARSGVRSFPCDQAFILCSWKSRNMKYGKFYRNIFAYEMLSDISITLIGFFDVLLLFELFKLISKIYKCAQCDFQSAVAAKLTKHMKTVHKTNKEWNTLKYNKMPCHTFFIRITVCR